MKTFEKKPISHFQRIHDENIKTPTECFKRVHKSFVQSQQLDERSSRVVSKLVEKETDYSHFEHMKKQDFSMENLLAAGVSLNGSPLSMSVSQFDAIAQVEAGLSKLDSKNS